MPEEFEGDLAGAVFWGADLTGARFRDVNLTNARISHAWLVNVDIDALVENACDQRRRRHGVRERARPVVPAARHAPSVEPGGHARDVGGARRRAGEDDQLGRRLSPKRPARVGQRRVDLRPDPAASRVRDGQVVHGADPRRAFPPDGVAEHRLPRLPVARPRSRTDAVCLRSSRRTRRIAPRAFATTSLRSRRPTSPGRSTCSRTARTRCKSASTPSLRSSSGTTAMRRATSRSWKRRHKTRRRVRHRSWRSRRFSRRTASGGAGASERRKPARS